MPTTKHELLDWLMDVPDDAEIGTDGAGLALLAVLGNAGIVTTLVSHYVTNVMNADPETKLGYGQNAPLGFTAFATCNMLVYLTCLIDRLSIEFVTVGNATDL